MQSVTPVHPVGQGNCTPCCQHVTPCVTHDSHAARAVLRSSSEGIDSPIQCNTPDHSHTTQQHPHPSRLPCAAPSSPNVAQQDAVIAQDEAVASPRELDGIQVARHAIVRGLVALPRLAAVCALEQAAAATAGKRGLFVVEPAQVVFEGGGGGALRQ